MRTSSGRSHLVLNLSEALHCALDDVLLGVILKRATRVKDLRLLVQGSLEVGPAGWPWHEIPRYTRDDTIIHNTTNVSSWLDCAQLGVLRGRYYDVR